MPPMPPEELPPLVEGTDEDDGKPYRVPGDPDQKVRCENCRKLVPPSTVVCNHCGFNRQTGETLQRVHEWVDKEWEPGLPFAMRLLCFVAVASVTLALAAVVSFAMDEWGTMVTAWLTGTVLFAFVAGSYCRVNLTRNPRGKVRLTKTWRICFIPLAETNVKWKQYEGIIVVRTHELGMWDWLTLLFFFMAGVIPAILWWIYVMSPDEFDVALTRDHGCPTLVLYRGHSEKMAKDIVANIRNVTGLD
jgi:hypothetical protein